MGGLSVNGATGRTEIPRGSFTLHRPSGYRLGRVQPHLDFNPFPKKVADGQTREASGHAKKHLKRTRFFRSSRMWSGYKRTFFTFLFGERGDLLFRVEKLDFPAPNGFSAPLPL